MTTTTRRRTAFALLAGATTLTLSACGDGGGGASPGPTVAVTQTQTAPTSAAPTSAAPSPTSLPATSSPRVSQSAGSSTCVSSQLRVRYADDKGGAGAGSVTGTFTFTNTGDGSCTLRGFPGVSYVGGSEGEQVGRPATRTDEAVSTTTLKAGGRATAALRRSQPGNYGSSCQKIAVRGFRVYAPGDTGAVFVPFPTTGCKSPDAPLLQVGPVR